MKVQILQEDLIKILSTAVRFTTNKVQLPILANLHLSAKKNKLIINATDLEVSISTSIGAKVIEEGDITVPSRILYEIISNLKSGTLELTANKEIVSVKTSGFTSTIPGMNSSDYPKVPDEVGAVSVKMEAGRLTKSLSKVLFSVSNDETRPVLTGVLFILGEKTRLVATDGFRLSQVELDIKSSPGKTDKEKQVIIPKNVLTEIVRLAGDDEIEFSLNKNDNQIVFGLGDTIVSSRVIDGAFPDFEKIIPKDTIVKVNTDKEEFLRSVKLASVFAKDSANVVKLEFEKNGFEIKAESSSSGSDKVNIDAKIEGLKEKLTIAFNYRFLEDLLSSLDADDVDFEMSDANSPALFLDPKDKKFLHIIMPVRLQD